MTQIIPCMEIIGITRIQMVIVFGFILTTGWSLREAEKGEKMVEIDYLSIFWYLVGEKLLHTHYMTYDENWDHDHCEFCGYLIEDKSKIFYCTEDEYYWVCEECFDEFKDLFKWQVLEGDINTSTAALETDGA